VAVSRRTGPAGRAARGAALLAGLGALLLAAPAQASPETLKRALGNILFAPLDVVLSPVVAAKTVYDGVRYIDDSLGVRLAYPVPGVIWNTGIVAGIGVIREMTGLLELIPGLLLFFSEDDLDPLLDPAESADALVEIENDLLPIRFGVLYTA
jgi:hypothetical protein